MNYGHGGLISAHQDTYSSAINETNCSEHFSYGGQRIVTFMMYLVTWNWVETQFSPILDYLLSQQKELHCFGSTLMKRCKIITKLFIWVAQ